jgi:molybdenum cofactor sulfurtransferase
MLLAISGWYCVSIVMHIDIVSHDGVRQGPIVSFNVLRSDGSFVGYNEVQQLANLNNIHLRVLHLKKHFW